MKKIFLLLIVFIISSLAAAAAGNQVRFYFRNGTTPITNVNTVGYQCPDPACTSLGTNFHPLTNSGSNDFQIVTFPETSSLVNYGMYFGGVCYASYEQQVSNSGGNNPIVDFTIPFNQIQNCASPIVQFDMYNIGRRDYPIIFGVTAQLDTQTRSAFSHAGPLEAVPASFNDDYSAMTNITFEVLNSTGQVEYNDSRLVNIYAETTQNVNFTFTPQTLGIYTARVTTDVVDCQCDQTTKQSQDASRIFNVYLNNTIDSCQTNLYNMTVDPSPAQTNSMIDIDLERLSVWQHNAGLRDPIPTNLTLNVHNSTGDVVYTVFNQAPMVANANYEEAWNFNWTPTLPGMYTINVTGVADSGNCTALMNEPDILTAQVQVNGTIPNTPPQILNQILTLTNTTANIYQEYDELATVSYRWGDNISLVNGPITNTSFRYNHTLSLTGLLPNTTYYYNTSLVDTLLLGATYGTFNFTTPLVNIADNPPNVTLLYPNGITIYNVGGNVTLNYTVTDDNNVTNCTMYNNATAWSAKTVDTDGTYDLFPIVNLSEGDYEWNVLCYDNASQSAWGGSNFTFTMNRSTTNNAPIFTQATPATPLNINTGTNQLFNVTVEDPEGTNMTVSWFVNQLLNETDLNVANGTNADYSYLFNTPGLYNITSQADDGMAQTNYTWAINVTTPVTINNSGLVLINEYMADPSVAPDWVELYNNETFAINLTGWSLNDSASSMATLSGVINPNSWLQVNVSNRLNLGSDTIQVINSTGHVIDSYSYTATQTDVPVGRYPDGTNNWFNLTTATPGAANIYSPNNAPTFDTPLVNASVQNNTLFTYDINASDVDAGDVLTFSDNAAQFDINSTTGLVSFTPTTVEVITATITVCDNSSAANNCTTQPFQLNVTATPTNNAPTFTSAAVNTSILNNTLFTYDVNATDLDAGDTLTYYDDATQFNIDPSTGLVNFTPTTVELITATLTVCDDSGFANNCTNQTFQLNVTVPAAPNNAPTFDTTAVNASVQNNTLFTYDINASDADIGDTLTFSDNAAQFNIDPSTGLVNFTPTTVEVISATITVCDDSGAANNCTTQPFQLNVTAAPTNNAPTFTSAAVNTSILNNTLFTYDVNATDLDAGDTLTYYDDASQFNIDSSTGLINFTPTTVELITATLTVCDDSGFLNNCTNQTFQLNVTAPIPIYGVQLSQPLNQTITNSTTAQYIFTVTNNGTVTDTYDIGLNNVDGATTATLNTTTVNLAAGNSAHVSLTVGDTTPGNYTTIVNASSQGGTAVEQRSVTTQITTTPVYTVDITDPTGQTTDSVTNVVYNLTITNTGNMQDSYTLSVNNPQSADTATLNSTTLTNINPGASIDVSLTVGDSTAGQYNITVTATSQTNATVLDTTNTITTTVTQAQGNITGTVTDANNNIYNANVVLLDGDLVVASTNTDTAGQYNFNNIGVGQYNVSVTKAAYNNDLQLVTLTTGGLTHNVVLTPAVFAGSISGSVRDGNTNNPIAAATVTVRRSDTGAAIQIITADGSGNYIFNGMQPTVGFTYNLEASAGGYSQSFGPQGLNLNVGESKTGQNIYLI